MLGQITRKEDLSRNTGTKLPKRKIYLCVEGKRTEKNYFEMAKEIMPTQSVVMDIEIIKKLDDGSTSFEKLIEELDMYKDRNKGLIMSSDILGIVVDRDNNEEITESIIRCKDENYNVYLSNPCFEFWLLLHISCEDYTGDELESMLVNKKVSSSHTYISKKISEISKHNKKISIGKFNEYYAPNIKKALKRAEDFNTDLDKIVDNLYTALGTNIPALMKELGFSK